MHKEFKALLIVFSIAVLVALGAVYLPDRSGEPRQSGDVTSFAECAAAGNPVMESYPRQCRHEGELFVEDIGGVLEKRDLIRVDSLQPGRAISSPLTITGEARGYWFFEADFPVMLVGENGALVAEGIASAQDAWMTEDFVPFEVTLTFTAPRVDAGVLVLVRDNPSGLAENADALRIPVVFADAGGSGGDSPSAVMEDWPTYQNERFGFTVRHPHDWIVHEFPDERIAPRFNIVPQGAVRREQFPLTHHSDAVQVSIFPQGVPTEGVAGVHEDSTVAFNELTRTARDYVLESGAAWGTFATFREFPDAWSKNGFVWTRAPVRALETSCFSEDGEVAMDSCDALMGDTLRRSGYVDESVRAIEAAMIESFRFLE